MGSDLGLNCFHFRFELEEDMRKVLANSPYHYHRWMVVLQQWEPVISSIFPSHIPFWNRLQGLPLLFWHEEMIRNIGHELGHFDTYRISKTAAKDRVFIDAFKPLILDPLIEFDSREELVVSLEYEDLQSHCSICFKLTHSAKECPLASLQPAHRPEVDTVNSARDPQSREEPRKYPFHQRIDRYGRPFESRIPPPEVRGQPLKNKLIPSRPRQEDSSPRKYRGSFQTSSRYDYLGSQRRPAGGRKERHSHLQWRENDRTRTSPSPRLQTTNTTDARGQPERADTNRQPLGRNLAICDFPLQRRFSQTCAR